VLKKCSKACLCVIHLHQNIKACYYGFMTVLVFGVFDILHPGHIYFLDQVIQLGGDLHICLASDEYVKNYKNRQTIYSFKERSEMINKIYPNIVIHKGDIDIGKWTIFNNLIPDIVATGYDQEKLEIALKERRQLNKTKFVKIIGFNTDMYSTTKIQDKNKYGNI